MIAKGVVLLSERDADVLQLLMRSLTLGGYRPVHPSRWAGECVDAIVADADCARSAEILELARGNGPHVPLIFISAYPRAMHGWLPDFAFYLEKPFLPSQLLATLDASL
jgi:hypothetical protein